MSRSKSQQFSQLSIVLGLHVSHYPVYTEITKITSSIDAKIEPHEGRNMASVNLTGTNRVCNNIADKVVLGECLKLSVLLKMNSVQFMDLNYFFQQYLHFERS